MDDKRFDNLARSLGAAKSRRGFLKVLGGTAVVVAAGGATEVAANPTTTTTTTKRPTTTTTTTTKRPTTTTTTKKPKCRAKGHPSVGNGNTCCSGKHAKTGPGNVYRCL